MITMLAELSNSATSSVVNTHMWPHSSVVYLIVAKGQDEEICWSNILGDLAKENEVLRGKL